ncbi:MAG: DNA-processing protein DprA [Dysgonamonadaceae bacterium]|nr:DNA-processing protein DprA [Dysgonamonadaceae bacterium]MDD4727741.1 DNA-processing protein DprA [Dysgonamonadaceae bacterium]
MSTVVTDKALYQIALTHITGVGVALARNLMQIVGDEEQVFKESANNLRKIQGISTRLVQEIRSSDVLRKAEEELNFVLKNNLQLLFFTSPQYPQRLTHCIDAPILLYVKGESNLNYKKVISIIGTRNASSYGCDACKQFVKDLSSKFSDLLIVSGLAYGIDICAHRAALENNVPTIAVLAHGLDRIYPSVHRKTAIDMLDKGGLVTEFPSKTEPERFNFVRRNRIVAGLSDALIVIESADKGGSLITAEIANSYYREVFALPGRVTDRSSVGCNRLISSNRAILMQDVKDFVNHMGWDESAKPQPKQKELFLQLTETEERVFNALNDNNSIHVNMLAIDLNIPVSELFFTLLELEMKNVVKPLPGGVYKLL